MAYYLRHIAALAVLLGWGAPAAAQSFDDVGTRAAGMGGAFVAVADDASAAYWNPAGFASGNIFTIVLDRTALKSDATRPQGARKGSGLLFALGIPALGLSYYQVRSTVLASVPAPQAFRLNPDTADALTTGRKVGSGEVRVDTLVTHHTGATLVQSVGNRIAVGATVKVIRGIASSDTVADGPRDRLLAEATEIGGKGSTRFDTDVGIMASGSLFKVGVTVRNIRSPGFETTRGDSLKLARQARAGIALAIAEGWVVDADLDLTTTSGPLGAVRQFATGTEGRLGRKAFVRGGLRLNTKGDADTAVAAGGSYMVVTSLLLDAQVTRGGSRGSNAWGISARLVY